MDCLFVPVRFCWLDSNVNKINQAAEYTTDCGVLMISVMSVWDLLCFEEYLNPNELIHPSQLNIHIPPDTHHGNAK